MTALVVIILFFGFVVLDAVVRAVTRRVVDARARRERELILHSSVRLEFNDDAGSLKRVEVPRPKARILAVDDESVILDSFRKILVLAGYSVDTVESGPEALGLIRRREYDFVFTDLKMPDMDGLEVVKAVKHLRPDIDVVVITGFGSIETAVETMQHGGLDYVQKPFTEEELVDFADKLCIKREARLDRARRPAIRIDRPDAAELAPSDEYFVAGGTFLSTGHTWLHLEENGRVRVGVDDFARKALGQIDAVVLPGVGSDAEQAKALFTVERGGHSVRFLSPVSGRVVSRNAALEDDPGLVCTSPYASGWLVEIEPSRLTDELRQLYIGLPAIEWYQEEIARLRASNAAAGPGGPAKDLEQFEATFLRAS